MLTGLCGVMAFVFFNDGMRHAPCAVRIFDGRGRSYRVVFKKDLTDRALKLLEVAKPKSNWELQGLLGLVAFVLGFLAGK